MSVDRDFWYRWVDDSGVPSPPTHEKALMQVDYETVVVTATGADDTFPDRLPAFAFEKADPDYGDLSIIEPDASQLAYYPMGAWSEVRVTAR